MLQFSYLQLFSFFRVVQALRAPDQCVIRNIMTETYQTFIAHARLTALPRGNLGDIASKTSESSWQCWRLSWRRVVAAGEVDIELGMWLYLCAHRQDIPGECDAVAEC